MQGIHKLRKNLILSTQSQTDVTDVVTPSTEMVLDVQQQSTSVRFVRRLVILVAYATREEINLMVTKGP